MTNLPLWIIPLFPLLGTILLGAIAVISSGSKKGPSEGFVGALSVLFPVISFVGFAKTLPADLSVAGQIFPLFSIAVAAAEACVGLALVILIFRNRESVDSDNYSNMKG